MKQATIQPTEYGTYVFELWEGTNLLDSWEVEVVSERYINHPDLSCAAIRNKGKRYAIHFHEDDVTEMWVVDGIVVG